MNREIELKLSLPHGSLAALRRHPAMAQTEKVGKVRMLDNTYFDTPDMQLQAHKTALRIRSSGQRQVQTVKSAAISTGGLSHRPEWEQPFSGEFDFSAVDATDVRELLEHCRNDLVPVFSTRFRRETRRCHPEPGVSILIMIDNGEVSSGERCSPLHEIELELAQGQPLDLLRLGKRFADTLPLLPSDISKAERGYRLYANKEAVPLEAAQPCATVHLFSAQPALEAFWQLAYAGVRRWQGCLESAAAGGRSDCGHDAGLIRQLHISQRRLHDLLPLFEAVLPASFLSEWKRRFLENARHFGRMRDADVLCEDILAPVSGGNEEENAALERLRNAVRRHRHHVRRNGSLSGQGALLIEFMIALETLPEPRTAPSLELPAFAAQQLDRLASAVREHLSIAVDTFNPAHAHAPPAKQWHALRLAVKSLQHGIDAFAPLLPAGQTAPYLKRLAKNRARLGFIHDIDNARATLAALTARNARLAAVAAFVLGWHAQRYQRQRCRVLRKLKKLIEDTPPWQPPG